KRNHEDQGLDPDNVQNRAASGVRPAAGPKKCEGGVLLSRQKEPDQHYAKPPAADRPLFEIHLVLRSSIETDKRTHCNDARDHRESDNIGIQGLPPSLRPPTPGAGGPSSR